MKKLFSLSRTQQADQPVKEKKGKKAKAPVLPTKILIGTCLGTKDDAESLARSQIERYFDTPDRSWLFIQEESKVGFHFEIHEGGDGRPLLPSLLSVKRSTDEGVIIKLNHQHAIEVFTRRNGLLQSLILPEAQRQDAEMDPRLSFAHRRMRPYATIGSEWIKVGLAALSMGILTMSVAGVIHKSFSLVMDGYYEVAETLPTTRLLELSGKSKMPGDTLPAINSLPLQQWHSLMNQPLKPGESVGRLSYSGGKWEIKVQRPLPVPAPTPAPAPAPVSQAPEVANPARAIPAPAGGAAAGATSSAQHELARAKERKAVSASPRQRQGQHEMSHLRGSNK